MILVPVDDAPLRRLETKRTRFGVDWDEVAADLTPIDDPVLFARECQRELARRR